MKNTKYNQVKNLRKTKNLLNETAMDWKQSNGCYPSIGEFTSLLNECLGAELVILSELDETREITDTDITQFANKLVNLTEDAADILAAMTDDQFENWIKSGNFTSDETAREKARKLRAEGQARKTGGTKTTPPPAGSSSSTGTESTWEEREARREANRKAQREATPKTTEEEKQAAKERERARQEEAQRDWEERMRNERPDQAAWEAANQAERDRAAKARSDDWVKRQQEKVRQQEKDRVAREKANPQQRTQAPVEPKAATTGIGSKLLRGLKSLGLGLPVGIAAGIGQDLAGNIADELHAGPVTKTAAEIGGAYGGEWAGIKGLDFARRAVRMKPTGWKPSVSGSAGFVLGGKLMEPYGGLAQFGGAMVGDVAGRVLPKQLKRVVPKIPGLGKIGKIPFVGPAAAVAASLMTGDSSYAGDMLNPLSAFESDYPAYAPAPVQSSDDEFGAEMSRRGAEYSPVSAKPQSKQQADYMRKQAQEYADPSPKLPTPTMVPTEPLPEQPMDQAVREFRGTSKTMNPVGTRTSRTTPLREGFDFGLGKYIGKTLTKAAIEALEKNLFKDAVKVAEKDLFKGAERPTVITNPNTAGEIKIPTIHPIVKVEPKVEPVVKTEPVVKPGEIVKADTKIEVKPVEKTTQLDTPAPAAHTLPANKKTPAEIAKDITKTIEDIWKGAITSPKTDTAFGGKPDTDITVRGATDITGKTETPPEGKTDIVVKDDETPPAPKTKIDEPPPPKPTRIRITDPRPPYTRIPEPTQTVKRQEEPQVGVDFAPNERYGVRARRAFVDPYTRSIFTQEVNIQEEQTTQPDEMKPADRLKDLPVEERQKMPAAEMERYGIWKREAILDPVTRRAITRKTQIAENKLSPQESLRRKTQKQKYKVVYVQDGKKVEVFASSIRGVRRVVYGKKQYRVHNSTGSDVTGYFKKLLGE